MACSSRCRGGASSPSGSISNLDRPLAIRREDLVLAAGTEELAAFLLAGRPHVATLEMVVHNPERLHRRVRRRGSDEPEPPATQLLGEGHRLRRRRGKVAEA